MEKAIKPSATSEMILIVVRKSSDSRPKTLGPMRRPATR